MGGVGGKMDTRGSVRVRQGRDGQTDKEMAGHAGGLNGHRDRQREAWGMARQRAGEVGERLTRVPYLGRR